MEGMNMEENIMNQQDCLYLKEALKGIGSIKFTTLKGAYFRGDYVSVSVETIEENGCKAAIVIICSAIGSWKVEWDKMAVSLIDNIESKKPCLFALFDDHGIAWFNSVPDGDYSLIPYNRCKKDILFPAQQANYDLEYKNLLELSLAAEGSTGTDKPVHFKSISSLIEVTVLPPGKETKIIFYSIEKKLKGYCIDFAFINPKTSSAVSSDKVYFVQSINSPEYMEGVWTGKISTETPLVFIFSDPYLP